MAEGRIRSAQRGPTRAKVHFFIAAPNGFTFILGRLARPLGAIQLYEHDFERLRFVYQASIELPPSSVRERLGAEAALGATPEQRPR